MARQLIDLPKLNLADLSEDDIMLIRDLSSKKDKRASVGDLAKYFSTGMDTSKIMFVENLDGIANGKYIVAKTVDGFVLQRYTEPVEVSPNPVLLYSDTGSGSGTASGKYFSIPIASYICAGNRALYSKVEIDIQFEDTGSNEGWKMFYAYNSSWSQLNTVQSGMEMVGTGLSGVSRSNGQVIAVGVHSYCACLVKLELYPTVANNYLIFNATSFGGTPSSTNKTQFITGRVNDAPYNVAWIESDYIYNVQRTYQVRMWGYQ